MNVSYILIPLISAFIGYFTNWIAIKMLFHPKEPFYFLGYNFQGIFPKRRQQFAEKLGKLISQEFLSFQDIERKISDPANLKLIMPEVEKHVDLFLHQKLAEKFPMISMFIGEKTISSLKSALMDELEAIFPVIMEKYAGSLKKELDLEALVVQKVSQFSSDKLEEMLYTIMAKEFKMVEILGGVLGFIIGTIQVVIAAFLM